MQLYSTQHQITMSAKIIKGYTRNNHLKLMTTKKYGMIQTFSRLRRWFKLIGHSYQILSYATDDRKIFRKCHSMPFAAASQL